MIARPSIRLSAHPQCLRRWSLPATDYARIVSFGAVYLTDSLPQVRHRRVDYLRTSSPLKEWTTGTKGKSKR